MYKILVVDDEADILDLLKYNLSREGYEVKTASDGIAAIELAREFIPNIILLDIMMPKMDGIEACRRIREIPQLNGCTIIFLTSRSEEYSEVAAFDNGANDYITKPIKPRALLSRISAFLRREAPAAKETALTYKDLTVDRDSYTVEKKGQQIILPRKEFELLYFLMQHPNTVYSREDLLRNIWGSDVFVVPRTVDVHVRKVREKIGEEYIKTVKGIGYKFEAAG